MIMINTGKLAGKTIFITGASRGIGKAIALKAAADGANIVIAAKTTEPHPKLPGTIYTAAKEVEAVGGSCLPCIVDIRNDNDVLIAVQSAVDKYGGIDILVNNASAISLTGTLQTPMKRYDLMNMVNARGTYLCSQACIPHLEKSNNGHILNISPPLNMKPKWFKNHVAYTMAKYGMSMCALGMAEELKDQHIAINCLWPKTAIITAAMEMLAGGGVGSGGDIANQCRKPDIVSDAAYAILLRDVSDAANTGNFYIDEEVLGEEGITDMDQYAVDKGGNLIPDFFLDVDETASLHTTPGGVEPDAGVAPESGSNNEVSATFEKIKSILSDELVNNMKTLYVFELSDLNKKWYIDLSSGSGSIGLCSDTAPGQDANVTMTMTSTNFTKMFKGSLKPTTAFMTGQLKIKGDMGKALKLEKLMKKMHSKL